MNWFYDGDGQWSAASAFRDDGSGFRWVVAITEEGKFTIENSTREMLPIERCPDFESLLSAKQCCEQIESEMIASA
jgi:hypothetical protein